MDSSTNETAVPIHENCKEEIEVEEDKQIEKEERDLEPMSSFFSTGHLSAEKEEVDTRMVRRRAIWS